MKLEDIVFNAFPRQSVAVVFTPPQSLSQYFRNKRVQFSWACGLNGETMTLESTGSRGPEPGDNTETNTKTVVATPTSPPAQL